MRRLAEFIFLNKTLFEAKKEAVAFFTDNKGKVHPIDPTPEAMAYARKMGFKHTIGGKAVTALKSVKEKVLGKPLTPKQKEVRRKVLSKNLLHDVTVGATTGFAAGASRLRGGKVALAGAALGAAGGAVYGVGEGLAKSRVLRGKSEDEVAKTVSKPVYRAADIAGISSIAAADAVLLKKYIDKYGDAEFTVKEIRSMIRNPSLRIKIVRALRKKPIVKALRSHLAKGSKLGLVLAGLGVFGAVAADSVVADLSNAKVYGADQPGEVGNELLFTRKSLRTGLYSGKKYRYGGFGQEIKTKKRKK